MVQKIKRNLVIPLILINLMLFAVFPPKELANSINSPNMSNAPMNNVVIDGAISIDEWVDADWEINFTLDVDNTPDWNGKVNVDGNNTLYIGEDTSNLYLALDLCSDRSHNESGEWIGLWLNTANRVFDNYHDWVDFFDDGVETLIYDVDYDRQWKYFSNYTIATWHPVNDDSEYITTYGTSEGNYSVFNVYFYPFNITSETVGSDELYWLNFSIDIASWFYIPEELDRIEDMHIFIRSQNNISINQHTLVLWNNDGSFPSLTNPQQVLGVNTQSTIQEQLFHYGIGNLTVDKKLQFSLIGNHSAPFKTSIDVIRFSATRDYPNWASHVQVPYSTIKNYQINWSFGPSPHNSTSHRMFEFSIPKTELQLYDSNNELGIIVGGYGTLGYINGSNFWVFSEIDYQQHVEDSTYYLYYNMKGLSLPERAISGYPVLLLIGVLSVSVIILIKKNFK